MEGDHSDGDHAGQKVQTQQQLVNGDVENPALISSNSQDVEMTAEDSDNCDKKAFSDKVVKNAEDVGEKANGLVNGDGGDTSGNECGDSSGSKVSVETKQTPEDKARNEKTDERSEEKEEKASCDLKVESSHGEERMEVDTDAVEPATKAAVDADGGCKVVEANDGNSKGDSNEEMSEAKVKKATVISEKNNESKECEKTSTSDVSPGNSRKRKSMEDNVISSDEEVHEEIVIGKKPKLQLSEKQLQIPTVIVPSTTRIPLTYKVGQPLSLGMLPNQQGTVRMVIPSMQNNLVTQTGQPLVLSPSQSTIFTTQSLTLGSAVIYPPLQAGGPFLQRQQNIKNRMPLSNKLAGPAVTTVSSSNASRQLLEMKTPTDSLEMMEMVKWEMRQGVFNRTKNFKLKPDSELGPMARLLRDFGQDLVKESVYCDLVRIQSRRGNQGKLSEKEKKDFEKLKSVHGELRDKVGPVMIHLKKKCKCGFKTESENVMHWHKQFPHMDEYDMHCAYCDFDTRTSSIFVFHMEVEHGTVAKFVGKPPFWECSLCPYESNLKNKLTQHRMRCMKTFKLNVNLHPTWLPGPIVNYCLEKIFYKNSLLISMSKQQARSNMPIMPKGGQPNQQKTTAPTNKTVPVILGNRFPVPATNTNRNPHLLASLNRQAPRGQIPTRMAFPNVNMFSNKMGNQQKQGTRPSPGHMTSKINSIISMNNQVLDTKMNAPQAKPNSGFEVCEICGGYVKDRTALRIHFFYAHRIDMPHGVFDRVHPPLYCATCFARFWTAQGLQKHLDVHKEDTSGGVAGKCIVCLHRVPNILMHMKIVHNKAFVNFLRDCKCIFCGTKFSSKDLVESHMAAVHGVVVKSGGQPQAAGPGKKPVSKVQKGRKDNLVKGSVCVLCNLNFGRNVDLTRHCMRVHHTCMKCGMVVADKESLMRHTCLESPSGLRNCELCGEMGFHPAYHVKHIRDKHLRKLSVRVKRLNNTTVEKYSCKAGQSKQYEIPSEPIELSDDDEPYSKRVKADKEVPHKPGPASIVARRKGQMRKVPRESDVVLLIDDSDEDAKTSSEDGGKKKSNAENAEKSGSASISGVKDDNSKDSVTDNKPSLQSKGEDGADKEGVEYKKDEVKKAKDPDGDKSSTDDTNVDKVSSDKEVEHGDTKVTDDKKVDSSDTDIAADEKTGDPCDKANNDSGDKDSTEKD